MTEIKPEPCGHEHVEEFAAAVLRAFSAMVPGPAGNAHYTSIVTPRHVARLHELLAVAREEIFGPILQVLPYDRIEDAVQDVADRPRPLAHYYIGADGEEASAISRRTHAGGVTLNDWGWHVFQHDLPFGGIGASAMGTYHGREGFHALSHGKAMFAAHWLFAVHFFYPPYGRVLQRLALKLFLGGGGRRQRD